MGWFDVCPRNLVPKPICHSSPNSGWNDPSQPWNIFRSFIAGIYITRHFVNHRLGGGWCRCRRSSFWMWEKVREARVGFRISLWFPSLSPQVVLVTWGVSVGKKTQEMIPRFCWWPYLLVSGFWKMTPLSLLNEILQKGLQKGLAQDGKDPQPHHIPKNQSLPGSHSFWTFPFGLDGILEKWNSSRNSSWNLFLRYKKSHLQKKKHNKTLKEHDFFHKFHPPSALRIFVLRFFQSEKCPCFC